MTDLAVLITVMVAGVIFGGLLTGTIIYIKGVIQVRMAKKNIIKKGLLFEGKKGLEAFQEEGATKEEIIEDIKKSVEDEPKIDNPCIICGKQSIENANTCSEEHYHQAMAEYHALQSEDQREPAALSKKEGEVKSLKDVSDTSPTS